MKIINRSANAESFELVGFGITEIQLEIILKALDIFEDEAKLFSEKYGLPIPELMLPDIEDLRQKFSSIEFQGKESK